MIHQLRRITTPKYPIRIEFEDEKYTYISGFYSYKELKKDIEGIKKPIIIHFTASQPLY